MGICGGCNDCEYVGWLSLIGGVFITISHDNSKHLFDAIL